MKNKIIVMAMASLMVTVSAQAQSTNVSLSAATNLVSADVSKLFSDLGNDILTLQPFTTNGEATGFAGGGVNTSSKQAIYAIAVSFPVSPVVGIGAVGAYQGGDWYEGGLNFNLGVTNNWPLIGTVRSVAGDGAVYDFKKSAPANYIFAGFEKQWQFNSKLSAGISLISANTSTESGVNVMGMLDLTYKW